MKIKVVLSKKQYHQFNTDFLTGALTMNYVLEAMWYYNNWYLSKSRRKIKIKGPYANVKLEIESGKLNRQLPDISKFGLDFRFF